MCARLEKLQNPACCNKDSKIPSKCVTIVSDEIIRTSDQDIVLEEPTTEVSDNLIANGIHNIVPVLIPTTIECPLGEEYKFLLVNLFQRPASKKMPHKPKKNVFQKSLLRI